MSDYFRGWRRKAGVLTLVTACVVMSVWIRSVGESDAIMAPRPDTPEGLNALVILSERGAVSAFNITSGERH